MTEPQMFRQSTPGRLSALLLAMLAAAFSAPARGADDKPVVGSIQLSGRQNVPEASVLAAVKTQVGQPFTPAAMEADRKAILGLGFFRSVTAAQQTAAG